MRVVWKTRALNDRMRYAAYLDAYNPEAAARQDEEIEKRGESLGGIATYSPGVIEGTFRYAICKGKFVLIYRKRTGPFTRDVCVEILRVLPSRSNWTEQTS